MKGTVLQAPGDIRFEDVEDPKISSPTDAVIAWADGTLVATEAGIMTRWSRSPACSGISVMHSARC